MDKFSDHNRVGKVYLVGSGPGNPGLLTVRARSLIDSCDVIVYDRLIGKILLDEIHTNKESIYVGKTPGKESYSQEQINEILIEEANKGKRVVRLKGGDPFVFGRGAEEAIALRSASVPFEVVPGVTSAISAPGAAGIPVTNRGSASYFSVVTASENSSKEETDVDWKSLAQGKQTLIILMGSKKIDSISDGFIYMVSSSSITGSKDSFSSEQLEYFERIEKMNLKTPRITGFGVANKKTFEAAVKFSKGAIIGSAFIKNLHLNGIDSITNFIHSIKD